MAAEVAAGILLILIALVFASAILPFASFWLCRDPVGASSLLLGRAVDLRRFGRSSLTASSGADSGAGAKPYRSGGRVAAGTCARSPRAPRGCSLRLLFSYVCEVRRAVGNAQPRMAACRRLFPRRFHVVWCWRG